MELYDSVIKLFKFQKPKHYLELHCTTIFQLKTKYKFSTKLETNKNIIPAIYA